MKKIALLAASTALFAFGGSQALAQPKAAHTMRMPSVIVVMHDPGCHWFLDGGTYKTSQTVHASMVRLYNVDEAPLRIAGPGGVRQARVGRSVMLGRGSYRITMVGQAPDDNHLKLTVS
jgi:hypothetical protein